MKFILPAQTLVPLLDIAKRFVSKNTTLPILQHMLLIVDENGLTIKATDMEKYIILTFPLKNATPGSTTVNAEMFFTVISQLDTGDISIEYNADKEEIRIVTGKEKFSLKTLPSSDYVALPVIKEEQRISAKAADLSKGIGKVLFSIQEKAFSPMFTGMYLHTKTVDEKSFAYFIGTDTFILSEYCIPQQTKLDQDIGIIIPKQSCADLAYIADRIAQQDEDAVSTLILSKNLLGREASVGEMTIMFSSILLQGNFPDYKNPKIMPTTYEARYQLSRTQFDKELRKVTVMVRDIKNTVVLTQQGEMLDLNTGKTEKGDGNVQIVPIVIENTPAQVSLNAKYLSSICKVFVGDSLQIRIIDDRSPIVFVDDGDENHICVVRPVQ